MRVTLQSDFYDEYVLGTPHQMQVGTSIRATTHKSMSAPAKIMGKREQSKFSKRRDSSR